MQIPRFWVKADGEAADPRGQPYRLGVWGWSHESAAEALATARRRLAEVAARVSAGASLDRYAYGRIPPREEVIRLIGDPGSPGEAVITRNTYGALVMNTAQVPFVDIDAPPEGGVSMVGRLFGRRPSEPALDRIREACARHAGHAFRLYRTAAGYRLLATTRVLDPRSEETAAFLSSFQADEKFKALCRVQGSFRARLTPKPWRSGCRMPPGRHPREDAAVRARFAAWLQQYEAASERFATCRFIEAIGVGLPSSAARVIVEEHDRLTRAQSDSPLA
jgi:hypothetical protein